MLVYVLSIVYICKYKTMIKMEQLKKEIKENGRTVKWISVQLNMSYYTLISYMNGYRTPPNDLVERIRKVL